MDKQKYFQFANLLRNLYILTIIQTINCKSTPAKLELRPDENTRSPVLSYRLAGPVPFQNVLQSLKQRNFNATVFCARGTWLLYDDSDYHSSQNTGLSGVSLVSKDSFSCFPGNSIGKLGSAQLVTSFSSRKSSTITFFTDFNFGGIAMVVNDKLKPVDKLPTETTTVKSLITIGQHHWTVILGDGIRLCIYPPQDGSVSTTPVCLLSNLVDNIKIKPFTGVSVVRKGCRVGDPGLKVTLTECYAADVGHTKTINAAWPFDKEDPAPKPTIEETTPVDPGNGGVTAAPEPATTASSGDEDETGSGSTKSSTTSTTAKPVKCVAAAGVDIFNTEQKQLIEARLNGSLSSDNQMHILKNPKFIWMIELFDKSFALLPYLCPQKVIDQEYLYLFANLFTYLLETTIWNNPDFMEPVISDVDLQMMDYYMTHCTAVVEKVGVGSKAINEIVNMLSTYQKFEDITNKVDKSLGIRSQYDHVIEIGWMMSNLVGSICLTANKHDINFYHLYFKLFHILYFDPLSDLWKTPGKVAEVYKYIFGGFGMQKSLAKIGFCVTSWMQYSAKPTPYQRPIEATKRILLPVADNDVASGSAEDPAPPATN